MAFLGLVKKCLVTVSVELGSGSPWIQMENRTTQMKSRHVEAPLPQFLWTWEDKSQVHRDWLLLAPEISKA